MRARAGSTSRTTLAAVVLAVFGLLVAACGGNSNSSTAGTTSTTAAPAPQDYTQRGPFHVGSTKLELDAKHAIQVFYPVDTVPSGAKKYEYSGAELFGAKLAAALPAAFHDPIAPADTWVDLPASTKGPFPVVLFSHGFGSWYKFSSLENAHVASWGYVVVAVDHPERGILASINGQTGTPSNSDTDVKQLSDALDLVITQGKDTSTVLHGVVDASRVAAEGHSAGGRASGVLAYDKRIDAWIGEAPAPPVPASDFNGDYQTFDFAAWSADHPPPDVPSMLISGSEDSVVPTSGVRTIYGWLDPPKHLVVIKNAGHNAFTDICAPIQQAGGLRDAIKALGFDPDKVSIVRLGEDGCLPKNLDAAKGYQVIRQVVVAELQSVFGPDKASAELSLRQSWLDRLFPGTVTIESDPTLLSATSNQN